MTEDTIDNSLLDYVPSEDESNGKAPLPDEGPYPNCSIIKCVAHKQDPDAQYAKPGVKARVELHFQCDERDTTLVKFVNLKTPLHPKSQVYKLMRAVFGDDMQNHPIADVEGRTVDVTIFHEEDKIDGKQVKYADYKFTKSKE